MRDSSRCHSDQSRGKLGFKISQDYPMELWRDLGFDLRSTGMVKGCGRKDRKKKVLRKM